MKERTSAKRVTPAVVNDLTLRNDGSQSPEGSSASSSSEDMSNALARQLVPDRGFFDVEGGLRVPIDRSEIESPPKTHASVQRQRSEARSPRVRLKRKRHERLSNENIKFGGSSNIYQPLLSD